MRSYTIKFNGLSLVEIEVLMDLTSGRVEDIRIITLGDY
jgi:hypothetical protein